MTISEWPESFERTSRGERRATSAFSVTLASAVKALEDELGRLDPNSWRVDFGNQHRKSNGMPLHNANPDDPGFVLKWADGDEQFAVACDHYANLRDNVREVGKWVKETRMRGNRPVETGDVDFAAARLPAGEEVVGDSPEEVLGVGPDPTVEEVQTAFREKVAEAHPDRGGTTEQVQRVMDARDELLEDIKTEVEA